MRVFDLHCDLLAYLASDSKHTPYDLDVRCSISQMRQGGVKGQTLAIFTKTEPKSAQMGWKQVEIFNSLTTRYSEDYEYFKEMGGSSSKIGILMAFENGSSFCGEEDDLAARLVQLEALDRLVYLSFTWNGENRFGGGCGSSTGLKEDGERLIDFLAGKQIAIDFSHASDELAYDILSYLDRQKLEIPVMASHSNFRAITQVERNLPDDLAKEIFKRGGIIGLNVIRPFVGLDSVDYLARQLEHGIALGGEDQLALGADFFFVHDLPKDSPYTKEELYYPEFSNSSCYPKLFRLWSEHLGLNHEKLLKIASLNSALFLKEKLCYNY